jgi:hypothetical protein
LKSSRVHVTTRTTVGSTRIGAADHGRRAEVRHDQPGTH